MGQATGTLEIYFSKDYFITSALNKDSCTVSWQVGKPVEIFAIDGAALSVSTSTAAEPGYYTSLFPFAKGSSTIFSCFGGDPASSAYCTGEKASIQMRNYYLQRIINRELIR